MTESGSGTVGDGLPTWPTPCIGRERELAEVGELLADPNCRLLTLVGPGGVGKTRLAVEAARRHADPSAGGTWFVALEAVDTVDGLALAMADALSLPLSGAEPLSRQLAPQLARRTGLVVLDDFDDLSPASPDVASLLAAAPGLKLLVTSRVVLSLGMEWLYPVDGLDVPADDDHDRVTASGAVQLFAERARRVRRDFSLADDGPPVARLCRLVGGLPLALELAAAWLRTLRPAEIADELERDLQLLAADLADLPARHRSMTVVFEHSWSRLGADEQAVLCALSVFRGGFTREAAAEVAGASLGTLSGLVLQSLAWRGSDGRYQMHELVRQLAWSRLAADPALLDATVARHGAFFAHFLVDRCADIHGARQALAAAEIRHEQENIRAAWSWLLAHGDALDAGGALITWQAYLEQRSLYAEAHAVSRRTVTALEDRSAGPDRDEGLAESLVCLAWMEIRLGDPVAAAAAAAHARALYDSLGVPPRSGLGTDPRTAEGVVDLVRGEYQRADRLGAAAAAVAEERADSGNLQVAEYLRASAALSLGDFTAAQTHATRSLAAAEANGSRWFEAYVRVTLGEVAAELDDLDAAEAHFRAAHAIRADFEDHEGLAVALGHLGAVALRRGDAGMAEARYADSVAEYDLFQDPGGRATALEGLGRANLADRRTAEAAAHLRQALSLAVETHFVPRALSILACIGTVLRRADRVVDAANLWTFVTAQPGADQRTRDAAAEGLAALGEMATAPPADLDQAVQLAERALQAEYPGGPAVPHVAAARSAPATTPDMSALPEPLTERELEVLTLLAEGLTNPEIAERLVIAVGTVKAYTHQIYGKLEVGNRTAAVTRARALGLLP